MTKAKLAFVHCRLGCLSCRPVCFFPRLFPFACLLLFACRRFRCPALGPAGFSPRRIFRHRLIVFSFPPSGSLFSVFFLLPVRCCSPVVVSLSGIGTCRLFPAADFSPSSYCLFLPAVRFVSFRLFPFAGPLLFACRRFRCPALGPAGFSPRRIFRHRLIVFSFPPSGSLFSVFFLLPVRCCSPVVVSLSGIGTCRLFPAADFSPSSYCLSLPVVRFVSFRLFPFACPLLFACRRFRCPAIGTCRLFPAADFSPAAYCLFLPVVRFAFFRLFPFAGISLPCLPFPSSLFVSDLSFLFFSSLFSPFCFFVFTGKRQAAVRPADMAAVWR